MKLWPSAMMHSAGLTSLAAGYSDPLAGLTAPGGACATCAGKLYSSGGRKALVPSGPTCLGPSISQGSP